MLLYALLAVPRALAKNRPKFSLKQIYSPSCRFNNFFGGLRSLVALPMPIKVGTPNCLCPQPYFATDADPRRRRPGILMFWNRSLEVFSMKEGSMVSKISGMTSPYQFLSPAPLRKIHHTSDKSKETITKSDQGFNENSTQMIRNFQFFRNQFLRRSYRLSTLLANLPQKGGSVMCCAGSN